MKNSEGLLHVRGRSIFTGDIPEPAGTLHAHVFTSPCAHGRITRLDTSAASEMPGVLGVLTWRDIPGENQTGNVIMDETLLAEDKVHYIGQPVAVVLADTPARAGAASGRIIIETESLPAVSDPREAMAMGELLAPPRTFSSGDVDSARKRCRHIITGTAETGGQEHLYLETQSALAIPREDGGVKITSSTQGPSFVQKVAARVLGMPIHSVEVEVPRLGGAFGGKEDQATPWAVMAALGAKLTGRPVRLVLSRSMDMASTGKRHPYTSDFTIGLDEGGSILFWEVDYYQNGGAAGDLSTAIMERTLLHCTGSYFIPSVRATGYCCRTNLAPNTAFRGFGAPQAMFVMEAAIHMASTKTGIPVNVIQERNLLKPGDTFPYGMVYPADEVRSSWNICKNRYGLEDALERASRFNENSEWIKKGVSMMPVCFGISFTTTFLNQASALVHVYTDGSVGISTGAVEMGQGVNSRLRQVAALTLGIPVERIRVEATSTTRNANTSPTAASSGADMNGNAVGMACLEILRRISPAGDGETDWDRMVENAYMNRISLSSHAHYATPGIHFDRASERGRPFGYHVAGTALTEVTVDCLLGTYSVDAVRMVHHGGTLLDPMLDRGQVEGGLLQGIGWVTMEDTVWDRDTNRLLSDALATYKVPDIRSAPETIEVFFAPGEDLPENVGLLGSRAIGEPPFMYGIGTWFAIADAIGRVDGYTAPMTPERLLLTLRKPE